MHEKERKPSNTTGSTRQVAPPLTGETALLRKDQVTRRILYLRTDQGVIGGPCLCPSDRLQKANARLQGMALAGAYANAVYGRKQPIFAANLGGGEPVLTTYVLSRQHLFDGNEHARGINISRTCRFANLRC
jgi:hypothetical protein